MAITTQESTEYTNLTASPPTIQDKTVLGGQVAIVYFTCDQTGAGDATSSFAVVKLPAGRVRVLGLMSDVYVNWTTASATIDAGWDAYEDLGGTTIAADPNGLDDGVSVETAGNIKLGSVLVAAGSTKVFESINGVTLRLTSEDVAIIDDDDAVGYIAYVAE